VRTVIGHQALFAHTRTRADVKRDDDQARGGHHLGRLLVAPVVTEIVQFLLHAFHRVVGGAVLQPGAHPCNPFEQLQQQTQASRAQAKRITEQSRGCFVTRRTASSTGRLSATCKRVASFEKSQASLVCARSEMWQLKRLRFFPVQPLRSWWKPPALADTLWRAYGGYERLKTTTNSAERWLPYHSADQHTRISR